MPGKNHLSASPHRTPWNKGKLCETAFPTVTSGCPISSLINQSPHFFFDSPAMQVRLHHADHEQIVFWIDEAKCACRASPPAFAHGICCLC